MIRNYLLIIFVLCTGAYFFNYSLDVDQQKLMSNDFAFEISDEADENFDLGIYMPDIKSYVRTDKEGSELFKWKIPFKSESLLSAKLDQNSRDLYIVTDTALQKINMNSKLVWNVQGTFKPKLTQLPDGKLLAIETKLKDISTQMGNLKIYDDELKVYSNSGELLLDISLYEVLKKYLNPATLIKYSDKLENELKELDLAAAKSAEPKDQAQQDAEDNLSDSIDAQNKETVTNINSNESDTVEEQNKNRESLIGIRTLKAVDVDIPGIANKGDLLMVSVRFGLAFIYSHSTKSVRWVKYFPNKFFAPILDACITEDSLYIAQRRQNGQVVRISGFKLDSIEPDWVFSTNKNLNLKNVYDAQLDCIADQNLWLELPSKGIAFQINSDYKFDYRISRSKKMPISGSIQFTRIDS